MKKPSTKHGSPSYRRLLKAALALFSQRGLNSVTIKDIAELAGLNTALIYYYFDSKEHLFESCVEDAVAESLETYEKLKAQHVTDPVNLIGDWFLANLKTAGSLRKLLKIIIYSAGSETRFRSIEKLTRKFYRIETEILASSIEQGIAQGIFRKVDAFDTAMFISIHLDGLIIGSLVRPKFKAAKEMDGLRDKLLLFLGYQK
jgi:TetR/AcrR family transcriptional regulator, upper aerobic nicotinate degradation pathway regulator